MLGGQGVRLSRAGSFTLPCPFASKQGLQKLDISAFKAGVVQKGREVRGEGDLRLVSSSKSSKLSGVP